jgi:hypothetical protein
LLLIFGIINSSIFLKKIYRFAENKTRFFDANFEEKISEIEESTE